MDGRSILLALIPVGFTLVNYAIVRDMIWGIALIGVLILNFYIDRNRTRKLAQK